MKCTFFCHWFGTSNDQRRETRQRFCRCCFFSTTANDLTRLNVVMWRVRIRPKRKKKSFSFFTIIFRYCQSLFAGWIYFTFYITRLIVKYECVIVFFYGNRIAIGKIRECVSIHTKDNKIKRARLKKKTKKRNNFKFCA